MLLVGVAGCGKSTLATRCFATTEVLSSDGCRALVADDPTDQSATADAFSVLTFVLDKRLRRGRLSVVDATNVTRAARKRSLGVARRYGRPPVAIVLDVPLAVCLSRDAARERTVGADVLRRQHADLERSTRQLRREGYHTVHVLQDPEAPAEVTVRRVPFEAAAPVPRAAG